MFVETEDYKTGWFGINISIRRHEKDVLIERLKQLKNNENQHFHLTSDFTDDGGVGDIGFNISDEGKDNMTISGFAIPPNR